MSESTVSASIFEYKDTLSRPFTTKGSIMSHDGNETFELVAPTNDGQRLVKDSTTSSGVSWASNIEKISFGFSIPNALFPTTVGDTTYFLVSTSDNNPTGLEFDSNTAVYFSVRPDGYRGWSPNMVNITGGQLDFTIGHVPSNTQQIPANFIPSPGGPHISVTQAYLGTLRWKTYSTTLSVQTPAGQLCIQCQNNFTISDDPDFSPEINCFIILRTK